MADGTSEPLEISHDMGKRIKASLADTELDNPSIRVKTCSNSKIPALKGWLKLDEKLSIEVSLTSKEEFNYSIKTGQVLVEDTHCNRGYYL